MNYILKLSIHCTSFFEAISKSEQDKFVIMLSRYLRSDVLAMDPSETNLYPKVRESQRPKVAEETINV